LGADAGVVMMRVMGMVMRIVLFIVPVRLG
jgi:hypothetical protein